MHLDPDIRALIYPGMSDEQIAMEYLAAGAAPLSDDEIRSGIAALERSQDASELIITPAALPPHLRSILQQIPDDWMKRPESHQTVEHLNREVEAHWQLPPSLYASLNEYGEIVVARIPKGFAPI